jgi:hypothetical protein
MILLTSSRIDFSKFLASSSSFATFILISNCFERTSSNKRTSSDNETVISKLLQLPFKPFQNKYDESGKMIEKRWGSPTEKEQPVDWINKLSPTYSKKLEENLNKIKNLLK